MLIHLPRPHLPPPEGEAGQEAAHVGGKSRGGAEDAAEVNGAGPIGRSSSIVQGVGQPESVRKEAGWPAVLASIV